MSGRIMKTRPWRTATAAALGLALVVLLYRHRGTLDARALTLLKDD